jgi:hypothetical protein
MRQKLGLVKRPFRSRSKQCGKSLICMEFFIFFLGTFSHLHALLEPPRLLISEKPATNTVFYVMNMKKIQTACLIRTSTLIRDFRVLFSDPHSYIYLFYRFQHQDCLELLPLQMYRYQNQIWVPTLMKFCQNLDMV